jgi:hypothetical protein
MVLGQTIVAVRENSTTTDTVVYTPWFSRLGDDVTSVFEVVAINPGEEAKLEVELYHKNANETGQGSSVGTGGSLTSVDVQDFHNDTLKMLLRYRVTLTDGPNAVSDQILYCHFRILLPVFQATGLQDIPSRTT